MLSCCSCCPLSLGQTRKPMTIAELVTYNGKDREAVLYAGAKTEGKVIWYTSLSGDSYKGMVKAFETKYPGVKLEAYRVSGSDMTMRMMEESKAKRYIVDAVETTEGNFLFMRDAFLLRPYHSPLFRSAIRKTPRKKASAACISGASRASPISALLTTRNFYRRTPCRKTTKGCSSGTQRPHGRVGERSGLQSHRRHAPHQRRRVGQEIEGARDRPAHDYSAGAAGI